MERRRAAAFVAAGLVAGLVLGGMGIANAGVLGTLANAAGLAAAEDVTDATGDDLLFPYAEETSPSADASTAPSTDTSGAPGSGDTSATPGSEDGSPTAPAKGAVKNPWCNGIGWGVTGQDPHASMRRDGDSGPRGRALGHDKRTARTAPEPGDVEASADSERGSRRGGGHGAGGNGNGGGGNGNGGGNGRGR